MTCGHRQSDVIESREREDGLRYRRRCCQACREQFSTVEVPHKDFRAMQAELAQLRQWRSELRELLAPLVAP